MLGNRLLWLLGHSLLVVLLSAVLAAEFSGRQPATLALDVGLSALRLVLPLLLVIQVQELFSREFDRKFYQISLAYPISRLAWFLGRFAALVFVGFVALGTIALALSLLVQIIAQGYEQLTPVSLGGPLWITLALFSLELLVLLSVACLLGVVASTPSFVLIGTFGFMLIARSYSAIIALLTSSAGLVGNGEAYRSSLGLLGYLLPDLGALDVRMIALYGRMELLPQDCLQLVISALFYALVFLALAFFALQRKRLP